MKQQTLKPKQLEVSAEDLAKAQKRKDLAEASNIKVSPEELFVAEAGVYFGWDAMVAILNNQVSLEDAQVLVAGARKVWNGQMLDIASVVFTANAAVQSGKKAKIVMTRGLKEFVKQAKADL